MNLKPILNNKWLLFLGILGVLFIVLGPLLTQVSNTFSRKTTSQPLPANTTVSGSTGTEAATLTSYENSYDKQLAQILTNIQGINKVDVMVTLDSTGAVVVANNTRDSTQTTNPSGNSGSSTSTTTDTEVFTQSNTDGSKVPYVINRMTPQVQGVLVTVDANDFYVAKAEIINAITNVLDVPAYKISVEPQKTSS